MSGIRRSIAFSFAERYGSHALSLLSTVILSRLLSPKDFGIFAIAMAFVALLEVFRDFGVGTYIVQEKEVSRRRIQTAFTITLGLSLICAAGMLLVTEAVTAFYGEAGLRQLMPLLAANFLLLPFSMPSMNLLRRDLAFDMIAAINLAAAVVSLVVVVVLARSGHGVLSLGWAVLAGSVTRTVAANLIEPCFWAYRLALQEWRRILAFGSYSTATAVINIFHDQLPQLIMGRWLGLPAVGLFSRAVGLCQLPDRLVISVLSPVILPALSEQARRGMDLKPAYLRALTYMSALQWPVLICLAFFAEPVVMVLLGSQWMEVAPLVRIMALAALAMFPAFMTYPTLVALGQVRDTLSMSLISLPPSILFTVLACPLGVQAVAAAQFINAPLQILVAVSFIRKRTGIRWGDIARAVQSSVVVTLCATAVPAAVVAMHGGFDHTSILAAVFAAASAAAGWLVGVTVTNHPLAAEIRSAWQFVGRRLRRSAP